EKGFCKPDKIHYLGNGIDVSHFRPYPDGHHRSAIRQSLGIPGRALVVGAVGRLVYEKGFAELFTAAVELIRKNTDLYFLVVGGRDEGQSDSIPPDIVESLRDENQVRLVDWQQEMTAWYSAMDLFVLPSHREGIPRACMEAAAMELPVIATDIRGCREV